MYKERETESCLNGRVKGKSRGWIMYYPGSELGGSGILQMVNRQVRACQLTGQDALRSPSYTTWDPLPLNTGLGLVERSYGLGDIWHIA